MDGKLAARGPGALPYDDWSKGPLRAQLLGVVEVRAPASTSLARTLSRGVRSLFARVFVLRVAPAPDVRPAPPRGRSPSSARPASRPAPTAPGPEPASPARSARPPPRDLAGEKPLLPLFADSPHPPPFTRSQRYPSLSVRDDPFTHNDGRTVHLLRADGTIPIYYQGVKYNIPLKMYLPEGFPRVAPVCYVSPTAEMIVKPGHAIVDASGLVRGAFLDEWRFDRGSQLADLAARLSDAFGRDPPLAKPTTGSGAAANQNQNPNPGGGARTEGLKEPEDRRTRTRRGDRIGRRRRRRRRPCTPRRRRASAGRPRDRTRRFPGRRRRRSARRRTRAAPRRTPAPPPGVVGTPSGGGGGGLFGSGGGSSRASGAGGYQQYNRVPFSAAEVSSGGGGGGRGGAATRRASGFFRRRRNGRRAGVGGGDV